MILRCICAVVFLICLSSYVDSATTSSPSTTPQPRPACNTLNASCGECVQYPQCIYCFKTKNDGSCMDYPVKHIIPRADDCDLGNTRWATCTLNYKALLIGMGTVAAILLLSCSGCVLYCCCCRGPSGRQQRKWAKEDAKEQRKKDERKMKQEQKKLERQARNEEIRRKYGLSKDNESQYHRMEDDY